MSLDQQILDKIRERQRVRDRDVLPYWRNSVDSLTLGNVSVKWSPYIPKRIQPTSKQLAFLMLDDYREVFYGGAARSGKTAAILMACLQYADTPNYHSIVFRRTITSASRPGGILHEALEWMREVSPELGTEFGISYEPKIYQIKFHPSGATLNFGFLDSINDYELYQGNQYATLALDELDQFEEATYNKLFTRVSKRPEDTFPLRVRCAANPGGRGHGWIKKRFNIQLDAEKGIYRGFDPDRPYVPAFIWDNPHTDLDEYVGSLAQVDPTTREQMLMGNWVLSEDGRFRPSWFHNRRYSTKVDVGYLYLEPECKGQAYEIRKCRVFQTVDPAASVAEGPGNTQIYRNKEPSNTAIGTWLLCGRYLLLWHVKLLSAEIPEVAQAIFDNYKQHHERGIKPEFIGVEATGTTIGVYQLLERMRLPVRPLKANTGDKVVRSSDAANRAFQGLIYLPHHADPQAGNWLPTFEEELFKWTGHPGQTADQIDMLSWAAILTSTYYSDAGLPFGSSDAPTAVPSGFRDGMRAGYVA